MHCTERRALTAAAVGLLVGGCSNWPGKAPASAEGEAVVPGVPPPDDIPGAPAGKTAAAKSRAASPGRLSRPPVKLPPPETPRNWQAAREQAARRMVAANPERVYDTRTPEMLLAIPVLTVDLNGDGTIRRISVMRYPSQARDTVTLAMDAVRRAAPFGNVSKLPKPWRFNETFLFNDERKFKPMTLDRR